MTTRASALVGRRRELDQLMRLATDPEIGAVLLSGRAGAGKTRLADALLTELAGLHWTTARLAGTPGAAAIPFASLGQLLPDDFDRVEAETGPLGAFTLYRAVERRLRESGGSSVAVLADDFGDLDSASAGLVLHLAANRLIFLVATERSGPRLDEVFDRLAHAQAVELPVGPLDESATEALATDLLGRGLGAGLRRELWEQSQGNPLFVRELVCFGREQGMIDQSSDQARLAEPLRIGRSLARQIAQRLGHLKPPERAAAELLAVCGPIGMQDLIQLAGEEAARSLEARELLVVREDGRRLVTDLAHPLYRETIAQQVSALDRRAHHRQRADQIDRHGARRSADRLLVSWGRYESGCEVAPGEAIGAARQALRIDRLKEAETLAEIAYKAKADEESTLLYSETLVRQGRYLEADRVLAQVPTDGTNEWVRVRRAIRRSSNALWGLEDTARAEQLDADCLRALREPAPRERVVAHQAWLALSTGRAREAVALTDPMSSPVGDENQFAMAAARAPALALVGRVQEAERLAQRAWEEEWGGSMESASHAQHLIALGFAKLYAGELEAAAFIADEALRICRTRGENAAVLFFLELAARVQLLTGRLDIALRHLEEGRRLAGELAIAAARRSALCGEIVCHAGLGQADRASECWHLLQASPLGPGPMGAADPARAEAWLLVAMGDRGQAVSRLVAAADEMAATGLETAELLLRFDVLRLDDASAADAERVVTLAASGQSPLYACVAQHAEALAARSGEGLDGVASRYAKMGLALAAAETWAQASDCFAGRGRQREADGCQHRSSAALPLGGMSTPALQRVRSITPLTRREREIAVLAARGETNAGIAERLHISVRTVENHLHRVYAKVGATNRKMLSALL